jgi:hypothetical protein
VGFDREQCLEAFKRFRCRDGDDTVGTHGLAEKSEADLALFAAGVLAGLRAGEKSGNGHPRPMSLPLRVLMGDLQGMVETDPSFG